MVFKLHEEKETLVLGYVLAFGVVASAFHPFYSFAFICFSNFTVILT